METGRLVEDETHVPPSVAERLADWPVLRQLRGKDRLALGRAAQSRRTRSLRSRTSGAERVVESICPYCAVGCGQLVYVEGDQVSQIEGDPASPISRGRLCPKGAASKNLVSSPLREYKVKYRRPYAAHWEELSLAEAMQMIADRMVETRAASWQESDGDGVHLKRAMGIAHLGGAVNDIEENYLMKKLYTALGVIQVENQARI